ncbi:MAG: hypothetical protein F6J95_028925 [Leptolyngbya sp. SIO1E4]|nr:hypothetical protein [Leptolyngbya sp. SIO1E4]
MTYANDEIEGCEHLESYIKTQWQSSKRLVVSTKVRYLEELSNLGDGGLQLNRSHIREALKRLNDHVKILEDNRVSSQGSDLWHFTLNLWHPGDEIDRNLHQFDTAWEAARPAKSKQVAEPIVNADQSLGNSPSRKSSILDWGDALDISGFYGREPELKTLQQWIGEDFCRLILLLGMGGIGKTALSVKLAQTLQGQFDYVIWRSLRNQRPLQDLLDDLLLTLSEHQLIDLPQTIDNRILLLLDYLRTSRCLIVLDNYESTLQSGELFGHYQSGYEEYGHLLRSLGESNHQSCLLLTSREQPTGLTVKVGSNLPIRAFHLTGVDEATATAISQDKGFDISTEAGLQLVRHYNGNPLALKIAVTTIQDLFDGDLVSFLEEGTVVFGDISELLQQQIGRLSDLELQLMRWLAIAREWISLTELKQKLVPVASSKTLIEALDSLQRRSLIEKRGKAFTQQPVVMEYLTEQIVKQAVEAILQGQVSLLDTLALCEAQAKDYIRQIQSRLILQPVADCLIQQLGTATALKQPIDQILETLKNRPSKQPSYAAGNLINLMSHLNLELRGYDFSHLAVWQVYLQALRLPQVNFSEADLSRSVFTQTIGGFFAAAYSPDGQHLATGLTNEIVVWNLSQNQQQFTCEGHSAWVMCVDYHPSQPILASGSNDQTIRLWDAITGQGLKTLKGHDSWIQAIRFSPNGRWLASGSNDADVRLWDITSSRCEKILTGHRDRVLSVHWLSDSQTLVTSSQDQTVRMWDVQTGNCRQAFSIPVNWALAIDISPDQQTLVTGADAKAIKFWNLTSGDCLGVLPNYQTQVWSVQFSPDGRSIATGSEDKSIKLWDVATGDCDKTLLGHTHRVWLTIYSPDGHSLTSASDDQTLKIWDVESGQCLKTFNSYGNWMQSVAFSPDGQHLASSSEDKLIRLWHPQTGECLKILKGHTNLIASVKFSPNSSWLTSASDDGTIRLWEVASGSCIRILRGHDSWVQSVMFSPDGQTLVSGSNDRTVKLWEVKSGECLQTWEGHIGRVKAVAFSPRGNWVASASDDKTVRVWEVNSGVCIQALEGHIDWVSSVTFHPSEPILASASSDRMLKLWDCQTGEYLETLEGHSHRVRAVLFSPDGKWLASCGDDRTVRLWNVSSRLCEQVLEGHQQAVWSLAFSPDGHVLASCSEDETLRLWQIETGKCCRVLRPERPYEDMNISNAVGLTLAQQRTLHALGAIG